MEGLVIRGMSDNSGADGGQPSVSRTGFGRNMTIKSCLQANVALPPVSAIGIARPVEYGLSNEERGSLLASLLLDNCTARDDVFSYAVMLSIVGFQNLTLPCK